MQEYVVVTRVGQPLVYAGRLVRFPTHEAAVPYVIAGDSIVPFDQARHHDQRQRGSE